MLSAAGLTTRYQDLLSRVRAAGPAQLMAVTKGVAAEQIAVVVDAGCTLFGENRVQELEAKRAAIAELRPTANLTWVLIGPLQSNKARRALEVADRIATVGSVELLERIAALATERSKPVEIALQVNVDEDPAKSGFTPEGLRAALPAIAAIVKGAPITVAGLFTVGRLTAGGEAARPTFAQFRTLSAQVDVDAQALGLDLGPLRSAGMSGDFEVAISEGSTEVRVGSALFGPRG
ncbi:MAG: YggS family pyridoxal phosphate-dependent enzyme [Candidatus Aquidulcis sp.]|nr:MAG: YggS family pyridoxal phosphate-dependent enzyme [Candidatus Aquidulcis sp.]